MVKAKAMGKDGRAMILMGISQNNVDRLREGQPIYFDPASLKIEPGTAIGGITLFYGKDDGELVRTIHTLIGPQTEVIHIPRGDERPT